MEHTFKTRITKDSTPVETKAEVVWDGVSVEQLQELALRAVIIEQQAIYRVSGKILATDRIVVADLLKRTRAPFVATPESLAARAMKMTQEEKLALVQKLQEQME